MQAIPESVVFNIKKYKIKSPEGYVDFFGVNKITKDSYIYLKFSNGKELKCSEDHPISTSEGIVRAKDLTKKIEIETDNGYCFVISKRHIKKKIDLYDIVNSGTKHLYYSNSITSHNCEFLGSSNTLINGTKLRLLHFSDPIQTKGHLQIYEKPIVESFDDDTGMQISGDHMYAMTVDVSEGKNLDYSAYSVFDISKIPYKQVAKYRNNNISPILFPNEILSTAKYYNNAFILVEINNNPQVAEIIHTDLEYENLLKITTGNKKAQQLSAGFTKNAQMGIKMSPLVKRIGCSNIKTLIENDKLIINDFDTISELTTFIADTTSFSADGEATDDLVMTLVLFGWLTSQKYFKEISNNDIRKQLQLEHFDIYEEEMLPVGEVDDGQAPLLSFMMDGDDIWVETNSSDPYSDYFRYIKN